MTGAGHPGACLVTLPLTATHDEGDERGLAFPLRDLILGGQDGLVNVLGLVLGLTAAGSEARTIVIGGLAALLAESVAMAGVIYTSAGAERASAWLRRWRATRSACSSARARGRPARAPAAPPR